jgi:hypothetical protein
MPALVLAKLLAIFGPLLGPWLPALARIRANVGGLMPPVAPVLIALGAVGAGIAAGLWLHSLGNDRRVARAAPAICDARAVSAQLTTLRAANQQGQDALAARGLEILAANNRIQSLEQQQQRWRDASADPDQIVVPPGDPWLVRAAPFGVRPRTRDTDAGVAGRD